MKSENVKASKVKKDNRKVSKKEVTSKDKARTKKEGFFKEVIRELKIVKWPDKKYMVKYSIATFVTIIMCSLYFYLITVVFALVKELR